MPSQFVLASQVTPIHTRRAMRLRLVRTYEVPELRGRATSKSKECLFHDEEENVDVPTELESLIGKAMVFKDESGADEVNSPNNVVLPRKPTGDQEMSPLSKRSLLDQFSSTQQMKKGRLDNIKKEKTV
nr:protein FAR1-RELATED SEQUENCE 5-like [Ipomoea batatas]